MTLVAKLQPGFPFLIGDLLISTEADTSRQVVLPTVGKFNQKQASEPSPIIIGMRQKLCILSDNLVVGWAGRSIAARAVMNDLKAHFNDSPTTTETVIEFLKQLDYPEIADVSLVGMTLSGNLIGSFGMNAFRQDMSFWGTVRTAGSGSDTFLTTLKAFEKESFKISGSPGDAWEAFGVVIATTGSLIGEEINSHESLSKFFGGGFEFVSVSENRFQIISDITYLFWIVHSVEEDGLELSIYPLAIKFAYAGDLLIIRRTEFLSLDIESEPIDSEVANNLGGTSYFGVTPIDRHVENSEFRELEMPDLESPIYCNYIFFPPTEDGREAFVVVEKRGDSPRIKFPKEDGKIFFAVHDSFLEYLHNSIQERFFGK